MTLTGYVNCHLLVSSHDKFGLVSLLSRKRRVVSEEVMAGTEIPGGGGRGRLYLTLHCHQQNDPCFNMGSDERHFNVSLIVKGKVRRRVRRPQLLKSEESRGKPKRNRTEVLLTSLTPYR